MSLVLSLPTVGPLLLKALIAQDMFLAGTIVLLLGVHDGDRHADLGPPADVDRSAHPARGHVMAEPKPPLDAEQPRPPSRAPSAEAEERISVATQWQLMWWRFRKHKLARGQRVVVLGFYLVVAGADFLAYADPMPPRRSARSSPPQRVHWFDDGRFGPYVDGLSGRARPADLQARLSCRTRARRSRSRFFAAGLRVQAARPHSRSTVT